MTKRNLSITYSLIINITKNDDVQLYVSSVKNKHG